MTDMKTDYPVSLEVDYPEHLSRLTTFFRVFLIMPVMIILILLFPEIDSEEAEAAWHVGCWGVGYVIVPLILTLLFLRRYPRWWFDWNRELTAFTARVFAYLFLLRDEYPALEEEQAVRLRLPYPDAPRDLNRWLPLIKWLLALPHVVVLFFLHIFLLPVLIIAWLAILFTGRYPRGLFEYVQGVLRWNLRVAAYSILMITDEYPPFCLFR